MPADLPRSLAFVDLETTGATAGEDRITEIGIVTVDPDGAVDDWQHLVNPGRPITPFVERLTGISDALVASAPPFSELACEVAQRLAGRLFVAHNARFDYGFLRAEFRRAGIEFKARVLCTVKLSRRLDPGERHHNLDSLIARHGLVAEGRHRALADARLIHQFWEKIRVDRSNDDLATALAALDARPPLPPQIAPGLIDDVPESPGLYMLHDGTGTCLAVGSARNLQKHLLTLLAKPPKGERGQRLARETCRIDWQETAGELGARLREAALIARLRPQLFPHPRRHRPAPDPSWPFQGPAGLRDGDEIHLIDRWRYLGTARDESELAALFATPLPTFDSDHYTLLVRHASKLQPIRFTPECS